MIDFTNRFGMTQFMIYMIGLGWVECWTKIINPMIITYIIRSDISILLELNLNPKDTYFSKLLIVWVKSDYLEWKFFVSQSFFLFSF